MNGLSRRIHLHGLSLVGLLLLFFLCGSVSAGSDPWAPFDAPWFDQAGTVEGLPQSIITSLAQDRSGLVWVGTMVGLARYDGYRAQVFDTRNSGSGQGLPDAYVRSLFALPDGGLLIGTNAGGLVRFDPATNRCQAYPIGANGISDRKIYDLADDHAGGVWIATDSGLDHFDSRTNAIVQLKTGTGTAARNFSVMQDRAGNLWLGNNDGLFVRHAGSKAFMPELTDADFAGIKPWFGYRPVSPDGMPYIGRLGRYANLSTASGHAMLGLTLAPISGLLIAEVLGGRKPSVDLSMLSPNRFA